MAIDITEHFCSMLHSKPLQEFFFFFLGVGTAV
jgi:hypothetical protein